MLSGDNSILQRATQSKERTERATIIETAKTDILGQIAENKGENISKEQLKAILSKYFENIDTLELPDDLSNSDIKLNANQTYGGYKNIALSVIYNGTFSVTNATNPVPDITKHKWRVTENGEETGNCIFNKDGKVYCIGESEPNGTYTIDGSNLTYNDVEFKWDGEKFAANFDDGEGYSALITITEIIPSTFKFTIDGTEYTAEEGMTWADWVASDYNTGSYYVVDDINNNYVFVGDLLVTYGDYELVLKNQLIDNTIEYSSYFLGE